MTDKAFSPLQRPKLDLRHLRHAVLAADFGSLRQAAETTSIKQSTLSRSIRQLEFAIGAMIFDRKSGGVKPTQVGRQFLRVARALLEQADILVSTTRADANGETGRLAIGFCTSLSAGNLRATVAEFRNRCPQLAIAAIEQSRERLELALRNYVLDVLVVAGDIPSSAFKRMPLWSERILAVLHKDHELAAGDAIYWTDLKRQTVLLSQHDPGRDLEDVLNAKLVNLVERPRIERHDIGRGAIKSFISMGHDIALVLESDTGAIFSNLVYREIRDGAGPSRIGFSAVWRDDNENPALAAFLKLLAERYPVPS